MGYGYDIDDLEDLDDTCAVTADEEFESEYDSDGEDASFEDIDFEALGIDPNKPTAAKPGSEEKVLMLAARYAAGIPLWHDHDCYDHGPGASMSRLLRPMAAKNN